MGPVRLTGLFRERPGADSLLVVVHGLGGSCHSYYTRRAAVAAERAGLSCLRLNLRGADRLGDDFYHAGLTVDLDAALASAEAVGYESVYFMGYSMGGHLALRHASTVRSGRVRAVAAVCSPLDLANCCAWLDRPAGWLYRHYILEGLKSIYRSCAARRSMPTPLESVLAVKTMHAFDTIVVAPRHGFFSAEDYYAKASAGTHLRGLNCPALLVSATNDPMVPVHAVRPWSDRASAKLENKWVERGGHVGFPPDLDLGLRGHLGMENQVLAWLLQNG